MAQFDKRNISMMMDLYEMTMANGYFASQKEPQKVVFDVFYRKNPDQGGYAIFAGLEQVIEYVENLHFDREDIAYFRSLNLFSEEFLEYLKDFRFSGDIYAFPEGTIMYPNEPILRQRPAGLFGRHRDGRFPTLEQDGRTIWMRQSTERERHILAAHLVRQL